MKPIKKIYRYSLEGDFMDEFESVAKASEVVHVSSHNIYSNLRGNSKTCGGFQFSYDKKENIGPAKLKLKRSGKTITNEELSKKLRKNLDFIDHGIISDRSSRDFGRRKITLGTMEIYCNPGKPVNNVVEKYSYVNLDF